jgi:hypothetical protein
VHRFAISGLVALAAALGGAAVPAAAMAQPAGAVAQSAGAVARPTIAVRAGVAVRTARTALAAAEGVVESGKPLISCVLSTDCLGVDGSSSLTTGGGPSTPTRVARWNGSSWKGVGVALPKGAKSVDLSGVSCKGAKSCLVVGDYYTSTSDSAPNHALALSYNGTSLRPTPTVPLPKGTTASALGSVSCVTTRYCVALGEAEGNTAAFGGLGTINIIETWNGAKWTLHPIATTIGTTMVLEPTAVSCATSAFCVVAGEATSATSSSFTFKLYAASWNGKKLTAMKPAPVGSSKDIPLATGVSCATPSNCAVTGADVSGEASGSTPAITAFTEIWNGRTWALGTVAWPKGVADSATLSVSCYAAHSCEAVGQDGASTAETSPVDAAAVSFNGTAGTVQTVPAPPKGDSAAFADVSCLPWASCIAAGGIGKPTATTPALMTGVWNGKAWKLDPGF